MINLLPPEQKEGILTEKKFKLLLVLEIVFLASLLSFSLLLFLVNISILNDLRVQETILQEKEKSVSLNKEFEEKLNLVNADLSFLNRFYQENTEFTQILEKIPGLLPPGIYLTDLNFAPLPKEKNAFKISLAGFCPNRETLLLLKGNLEKEAAFSEIYFPTESWLKPSDINFAISLNFKK